MEIHIYTRKSNKNRKISINICDFFFFCLYRAKRDRGKPKKKNICISYIAGKTT